MTQATASSGAPVAAIVVKQGKLLDFIDGVTQRDETPEEYVRQEIAKSLVREYGYPRESVSVEFTLRVGTRKPRADLVIFTEGEKHAQERASIIVECKSPNVKSSDKKEGVGQLQSYMSVSPNVAYGMWTNGQERFCYQKVTSKAGVIDYIEVADIPSFGADADEAERPRFEHLKPASSDALLFAFRRCHNYISGNQGLQKPEAFWELLKLIFCKIHDERNSSEVTFFVAGSERQNLNGQMKCKTRIDRLFTQVRKDFPQIFRTGEEVDLQPGVLAYIVSQLQLYALLESDVDVKGKAYEEIVGSNLRGDRGEFFTPRNICQMAVTMLDPDDRMIMLDPACGTGGFLITAMNHVIWKVSESERQKWGDAARAETAARQRIERYLRNNLVGIDLNPNLVKASKMNMVMNNDGAGGLYQANSLVSPATWDEDLRNRALLGGVDLIVTNPPFGSKIPIDDPAVLETYDLGHMWSYDDSVDRWVIGSGVQKSQPPEILFIERCVRFLKPGEGIAAMVLPDGILGSPGLGYVRQWLLTHTTILASVDLHPDTFQPSTSVQTSLLVFRRKTDEQVQLEGAAGELSDYEIFMAVADHVGHDKRGNVLYVRDAEGNEIVEELEDVGPSDSEESPLAARRLQKLVDDNTLMIARTFRSWVEGKE